MEPAATARSGSRRALAFVVPAIVAAIALLGWWLLRGERTRPVVPGSGAIAEPAARPERRAEPLESDAQPEAAGEAPDREALAVTIAPPPDRPLLVQPPNPRPVPALPAGPRAFQGLVLDLEFDQPVPGTKLVFTGEGASELASVESDAQGRFRTPALSGAKWMSVAPPEGWLCGDARVEVGTRRGDIVVPLQRDPKLVVAIRGQLVRERGAWTEDTLPKPNTVMLDLVPTTGAKWSRRATLVSEPDGKGNLTLGFAFENLLRGEYELTLSSLSAWRWSPTTMRVFAPAQGLSFLRYDLDPSSKLVFHVSDRESREKIEKFQVRHLRLTPSQENGVFLHTGPLDPDAFPIDERFSWSLWAEGYMPAFGNETDFVQRGDERVAEVALSRGWSTKVLALVRDPAAKPAVRAEVFVDGRSQGFTGADGMLVVSAASAPQRLEVRVAGWKMQNDPLQAYNGKGAEQRGQVTIVMLEKQR